MSGKGQSKLKTVVRMLLTFIFLLVMAFFAFAFIASVLDADSDWGQKIFFGIVFGITGVIYYKYVRKPKETEVSNTVKTMYVLTFTTEEMVAEELMPVVKIAQGMLEKKNPNFAKLIREMKPDTRIEIANMQYAGPIMHTPQTMQTALGGWMSNQYGADFMPAINKNFFPHGMKDPQGKENFFLFYFAAGAKSGSKV